MENLIIEKTNSTPYIELNAQENFIKFTGRSFPENTSDFYQPTIMWLKDFIKTTNNISVEIDLTYLNSSSLKMYFDIFDIFEEKVLNEQSDIQIRWFYDSENDVALETGEDFKEDFQQLNIQVIEKN